MRIYEEKRKLLNSSYEKKDLDVFLNSYNKYFLENNSDKKNNFLIKLKEIKNIFNIFEISINIKLKNSNSNFNFNFDVYFFEQIFKIKKQKNNYKLN